MAKSAHVQARDDIRRIWKQSGGYQVWESNLKTGLRLECWHTKAGSRILLVHRDGEGFDIWKLGEYSMELHEAVEQIREENK